VKKDEEDEKKEEICVKFKFSEVKQNLNSTISSVDSNPLPNAEGNKARCSKRTVQKRKTNQNKFIF
jgi:hypothetical protein